MDFRSASKHGVMSRRRFVQGSVLSGAALATLGGRAWGMKVPGSVEALSGTSFDLAIGSVPVNLTGRPAVATGVNGLVPGPMLRWRQGDTVVLNVRNTLAVPSSIHWHGIRSPADMDGVPALSFRGIMPGETFTYRIPLHQSGTYWYHSHSAFQEQTGLYGAIVVEPKAGYAQRFDRDHVVLLSDWSDSSPEEIVSNLKMQNDYYNFHERDAGTFLADARREGLGATIGDRLMWGRMRMSAADIADVTGATYTYLFNGAPPNTNWTGLFRLGERVRLRFINGSSMSFFDVRIPGLKMTVVAADGNDVEPVPIDEFRIGVAETYDVIVEPTAETYTIFAQSEDRTGFARGTLATRTGLAAPIPPMDPRPIRSMTDMGMGNMKMDSGRGGMDTNKSAGKPASSNSSSDMAGMKGMAMSGQTSKLEPSGSASEMAGMNSMDMSGGGGMAGMDMSSGMKASPEAGKLRGGIAVDNVAMDPINRLGDPGDGLRGNGRRVLTYNDLRATIPGADPRPPSRDITLHLTGNMQRYMWGFDGKKFSQAEPIRLARGERVRFTLINDTMMEHPIHLHGLWSELENGQGEYRPYKHTVIVQPGEKLSYLVTADSPGMWAYHCHLLYHMEMGMFRTVVVA
ncbi:copper resistance system multicopper oxidase [Lichenicoccus roseus]|uniref:Copper resistance system multicopper oxidase n=1 Tax=Lichenicoccus roseus TaxID=2683649 RepID=A0A5R9J2Z8_9PROT|nr:copper resistance system multicopper oxidase [Lichenicoccus roseus]TLU71213.1 copper resistance system multicopper oxidase [Lichenicoccus roseus]